MIEWKEHVYQDGKYKGMQRTHFTYTSDNAVESIIRAFGTQDSRITNYTYGPHGKVATKRTTNGIILSYTYNPLGYLTALTSSDGIIHHQFTSNKKGELLTAEDKVNGVLIQREVDPFGNVIKERFPYCEVTKCYDAHDHLSDLALSKIGSISYAYDPLHLKSVSRYNTTGKLKYQHEYTRYDLDGNVLTEKLILNAGEIAHHYDLQGRKTEIRSPYFTQKYAYDAIGCLTHRANYDQVETYTYDDHSQLISDSEHHFCYDSLFNRVQKDDDIFKFNDLNQLTDLSYDQNGNQIQKEDFHFTYDPLNRLCEALSQNKKIKFIYDPLGRRLTKVAYNKKGTIWNEGDRENYLYNGQEEIGAFHPDGTLKNFRVLGAHGLPRRSVTLAIELGNRTLASQVDFQGNIYHLIDPLSKKVVSSYDFTSFGEEKGRIEDGNPWRYAGKRWHQDLHLIDFGKRDYDPERGRWLTLDPAGFIDSLNGYQYAFNNPYSYYDPNGEFLFTLVLPFAYLFVPGATAVVSTLCLDALIVSAVSWGLYEGTKYAADYFDSQHTLSEAYINRWLDRAQDELRKDPITANRNKKKNLDNNYPGKAKDLEKNPDWKETTHPENKSGSREFENKKTGEKIRYDQGKTGQPGHQAHDHYHRLKPRPGSPGEYDYLDKNGKVVPRGHDESHLYPPEGIKWD